MRIADRLLKPLRKGPADVPAVRRSASPDQNENAPPTAQEPCAARLPKRSEAADDAVCFLCRVSFVHCLCGAGAVEMQQALAAISRTHYRVEYGLCAQLGCGRADGCVCVQVLERVRSRLDAL